MPQLAQAKELIRLLDSSVEDFISSLPATEKQLFAKVITLAKQLDLTGDSIQVSVANTRLINQIQQEVDSIISSDAYIGNVKKYIDGFSGVDKAQQAYFSEITTAFSPPKVLAEIKNQITKDVSRGLTERGLGQTTADELSKILQLNINSGGSYADFTEQLRDSILGTKEDSGILERNSRQLVTDSINQYSATYSQTVTSDLGLKWFQYIGSLIETSRPFCVACVEKRWIHESEFKTILNGNIDGKKVSLAGVNPETTPENFQILRGGFNCQHQLLPVSDDVVPKDVIQAFEEDQELVEGLTPAQEQEFRNFERQPEELVDVNLENESIKTFITDKDRLVKDYLKAEGNVINTDTARRQFVDIGYNGSNAASVQEASSALAKEALEKLVNEGTKGRVTYYAGGAGSCKTSTIETLLTNIRKSSDAIIDGNLSNYEKAAFQFDKYLGMGKDIELAYVYRDPKEAWEAVIKRMLNNKSEMGRAVPMSIFMKNTQGSYRTVEQIIKNTELTSNKKFTMYIFDNSLGKGNARWMDLDRFESFRPNVFDSNLQQALREITEDYYQRGLITKEQYETLLQ